MGSHSRRWPAFVLGAIAVSLLIVAPASAGAPQQADAKPKPRAGYDPRTLRGVQSFLRTVPAGAGRSSLFPVLRVDQPPADQVPADAAGADAAPTGGSLTLTSTPAAAAPGLQSTPLPPVTDSATAPASAADRPAPVFVPEATASHAVPSRTGTGQADLYRADSDRAERAAPALVLTSEPSAQVAPPARSVARPAASQGRQSSSSSLVVSVQDSRSRGGGTLSTPVNRRSSSGHSLRTSIRPSAASGPAAAGTSAAVYGRRDIVLSVGGVSTGRAAPAASAAWASSQQPASPVSVAPEVTSIEMSAPVAPEASYRPAPELSVSSQPARVSSIARGGYRLGAGDSIDVFVWRNPELSRTVPVRPDGRISLPLAGELSAEGKTAEELQAELTAILSDFIQVPTVSVTVTEIRSLVVYVVGNVASNGPLELSRNVDVVQAIAMAGGLNEFADKNGVTVLRTINGVQQRIAYPYGDVLKGKVAPPQLVLRAGDVIYVP